MARPKTSALKVQFNDDERRRIEQELEDFFLNERDEELDIIGKQALTDCIEEYIAPIIYNKALNDARAWYRRAAENMEADFYALYQEEE